MSLNSKKCLGYIIGDLNIINKNLIDFVENFYQNYAKDSIYEKNFEKSKAMYLFFPLSALNMTYLCDDERYFLTKVVLNKNVVGIDYLKDLVFNVSKINLYFKWYKEEYLPRYGIKWDCQDFQTIRNCELNTIESES